MIPATQPVRRIPVLYFLFLLSVLSGWLWYIYSLPDVSFLIRRWAAALTMIFGTYYVVPLISPVLAKLFFVSLWLSFGITLWRENRNPARTVFGTIPHFQRSDKIRLSLFGLVGGIISAIFGTGINIFTFCLVTIYYRLNEKVATPSSVIIMTIETLIGFFLHAQILGDFSQDSFELWLTCIPVVVFFAPLGAFMITKLSRSIIARILYIILFVQFVGAILVIRPSPSQWLLCLLTLGSGLGLFAAIARSRSLRYYDYRLC